MDYLHVLLIRASAAHKKYSRQSFQNLGLSDGQPKVLSILRGMEGCSQKELAKACHVEPATMTSLLKNMEQSDLIRKERQQLSGGKRAYGIFFTEHGQKMSDEVMQIVADLEEVSFADFSEEEKKEFLRLFTKLTENLEQ